MTRLIRNAVLSLSFAALAATPALAQKGGPASVIEVEKAARGAVVVPFWCPDSSGATSECTTDFQVPAGMRMVIEDIAIFAQSSTGAVHAGLFYDVNGTLAISLVPPTYTAQGVLWLNKTAPVYVDALTYVGVYGATDGTQPQVYVTTYLIKK